MTINAENLRNQLITKKQTTSKEYWLKQLNERKIAELEFHNSNRDKKIVQHLPQDSYELLHGNKKYYKTTAVSRQYVDDWIKSNARGKVFLDYACGNGHNAILAAQSGAELAIGLDISDVSVGNAQAEAEKLGLKNSFYIQGDCERTELPDNCIDTIVCSGMLHHLDLSYAFPELRRILKPGGKILAVEALNYNPIIKIYRMITPSMRTDWEKNHILSLKDITFAKRFFLVDDVRYWHIFSYFAGLVYRYPILFKATLALGNFLDRIFTHVPGIQLMGWQFTFVLTKRSEN
jgi:ubiquinone/menaquinone biosynthesis C-methylase UbiE